MVRKKLRGIWSGTAGSLFLVVGGILVLNFFFDRTREFKSRAVAGQPIVNAIESYRQETGSYPTNLGDLVPRFLAAAPEQPDRSNHKSSGWDYELVTNATVATYRLRYYLGKGGVEYEPPKWIGNDEGRRKVVLSNE